jgi:murein DD-endopeptidase MepM/ murein hydrolase activator NlpD
MSRVRADEDDIARTLADDEENLRLLAVIVGDDSLTVPESSPASAMRCPVRSPVSIADDFGAPRSGGRKHQGNDIFAPMGTPNVAVVDGRLIREIGGLGGLALKLFGSDGNTYYYAHLSAFNGAPRIVRAGDVVGFTGNTGNASGGPTHTHFEIHPHGGAAVDPHAALIAACGAT